MLRTLYITAGFATVSYLAILALMYFGQAKLLYFPTQHLIATPSSIGAQFEDVKLVTDDGISIHGWHVRSPERRKTLLFLHGNGGNISHRLASIRMFLDLGLDVLIIDYRGYGESEGSATEEGTYRDARAAWQYLLDSGIDEQDIIIFGRSLGAAIAANLAAETRPAGMILESPFTSIPDIAGYHYPWLPVRMLSRYKYDNLSLADRISSPVLVIHSPNDRIVPFELGRRLYDAFQSEKTFVEIRGGHNDGFLVSGSTYTDALGAFVKSVSVPRPKLQ